MCNVVHEKDLQSYKAQSSLQWELLVRELLHVGGIEHQFLNSWEFQVGAKD